MIFNQNSKEGFVLKNKIQTPLNNFERIQIIICLKILIIEMNEI
jgi:hypothetical protein